MRKLSCLFLVVALLCSIFQSSLADTIPGTPNLNSFALMITETRGNKIYITLSKSVDKLYANWPSEMKLISLDITEDLRASVPLKGHKTQLGVQKTALELNAANTPPPAPTPNPYGYTPYVYFYDNSYSKMATAKDKAFITLQGNWIVCYNRRGEIVEIAILKTVI